MRSYPVVIVIALIVYTLSLVGDIITILFSIGWWGLLITTFIVVVITFILIIKYRYLLIKNFRSKSIIENIYYAGIIDLEIREKERNIKAPVELINLAKKEIYISGISCYNTMINYTDKIEDILRKQIHIYVLMLEPNGKAEKRISSIENQDIKGDINTVLKKLNKNRDELGISLVEHKCFHLGFYDYYPPYTSIAIDCNISPAQKEKMPEIFDKDAFIRIQAKTYETTQHSGLLFTINNRNRLLFNSYVTDIRKQWEKCRKVCK